MRVLVFILATFFLSGVCFAQEKSVVIETRILSPDPFSGMKSKQTVKIDFQNQTVEDDFRTGTTEVFGIILESVRDNFKVQNVVFSGDEVSFSVKGTTASGVRISPDIDYKFSFKVHKEDGVVSISGCHDAYPAYSIFTDNAVIYEFKHKSIDLLSLFGTCDVKL